MLRWVVAIPIALLAGVMISVAGAWACVVWSPRPPIAFQTHPGPWPVPAPADWPATAERRIETTLGLTVIDATAPETEPGSWYESFNQWVLQAGLPWRCLSCARSRRQKRLTTYAPLSWTKPGHWGEGLEIPFDSLPAEARIGRYLPTVPIWSGLLANTTVFAAALLLVLVAPRSARRWLRARQGRCLACGYPLAAAGATCPECGT